ncbi:MAG: hypothetical protein U0835_13020 [Isosphaeraceae bacterium]
MTAPEPVIASREAGRSQEPTPTDRALAALGRALSAYRVEVLVVLGALLRLEGWILGRGTWLDENSLLGNFVGRTASNLFRPFVGTQLAPAGFFVLEWWLGRVLGDNRYVYRLFPLVCGIVALALFDMLARRATRPGAVWVAVVLFAVSGDLVYYSSEIKPYSTDVFFAVAVTLAGVMQLRTELTRGRALGLALLGAAAVWMSFPSALVLGGVGLVLLADAASRRDFGRLARLAAVCLVWSISFAGAYRTARNMLGYGGRLGMNAFWAFAFPPWPPQSVREALWPVRRGLFLFVNPLDHLEPFGPWVASAPAILCAAVGFVSLARRDSRALAMLVLPIVLALGVAYPRLYPFHGRLVLFLAPALILLIAEGADVIVSLCRHRWLRATLLSVLLFYPVANALYRVIEPNRDTTHDARHGDLRGWARDPERFPF